MEKNQPEKEYDKTRHSKFQRRVEVKIVYTRDMTLIMKLKNIYLLIEIKPNEVSDTYVHFNRIHDEDK